MSGEIGGLHLRRREPGHIPGTMYIHVLYRSYACIYMYMPCLGDGRPSFRNLAQEGQKLKIEDLEGEIVARGFKSPHPPNPPK